MELNSLTANGALVPILFLSPLQIDKKSMIFVLSQHLMALEMQLRSSAPIVLCHIVPNLTVSILHDVSMVLFVS